MSATVLLPTLERIRHLFSYDEETGEFTRRVDVNCWKAGTIAGTRNKRGYCSLVVDGRRYQAHRLVWKYVHGSDPKVYIDHINGNPSDNRISNLREADTSQNIANSRKRVKQPYPKGVSMFRQRGKVMFQSQICSRGVRQFIGYFSTPEEAHQAYVAKQIEINGVFASSGERA